MIPARGTVCPRKKTAVVAARTTGKDAQLALASQPAFQKRLAMLVANASMLTLNSIWSGRNLPLDCGQHCTTVEKDAMRTASAALTLNTAISRNGRLTDMLPSIPGSFTLMREVAAASASTASA